LPDIPLEEPSLIERLKAEQDILGFPVTDHPLALFPEVRWDSYCPIINLKDNHGKRVSIAGMIIEDRIHRQDRTGKPNNNRIADSVDFTSAVDGFYQFPGRWKILKVAMGCSIREFPRLVGVSLFITFSNSAAVPST
jgi:hypothetical protein